jgi:phospholipid transport system transporter-binding protein
MSVSEGHLEALGPGHYRVVGELGFDTAPAIWEESKACLDDAEAPRIDLGSVTNVDSAALALVIEWLRWGDSHGKRIVLQNVPDKLLALARISELDAWLAEALAPG